MSTLTIFCPESKLTRARTLSGIFGLTPEDYTHSFSSLSWTDGTILYSVHQTPVSEGIKNAVQAASQGLLTLQPFADSIPWPVGNVQEAQVAIDNANIILHYDPENPPLIDKQELILAIDIEAMLLGDICGIGKIHG